MSISDAFNNAASTIGLGSSIGLAQNAAMNSASNAAAQWRTAEMRVPRDSSVVGMFKILRAEDGFIVRCAEDEGYTYKTYVANNIDEAFDKAKAYLVTEALSK